MRHKLEHNRKLLLNVQDMCIDETEGDVQNQIRSGTV